ncbi:GGDEF domain-containing protein [Pigmentiphaga aceris]|uniref:diguanylate cyclase n=1 Tax=Pigmentiphaga aceris TaxID=1940612 RepID=A0A5C0B072_9BURK|nr:GGDEF domain-containing protein [Pigmentiphaga aceris]QEI06241.1 GGDEF domain-containing protein [Pigmentiphaga aceris]
MISTILEWSIPLAFWLSGIGFFILSKFGFDTRRWASAFCLLGTGYGLMTYRLDHWSIFKPLLEDLFLMLGTVGMTAALSHRFAAKPKWRIKAGIIAASIAGAAWCLAVWHSVRLETFAIQSGCVLIVLTALLSRDARPLSKGDRVLYVTFAVVCAALFLECVGYLFAPEMGHKTGAWRASIWGFMMQLTGGIIAVSLSFAILLAVSLDVMDRLRLVSQTDALTGLLNRSGMEEACTRLRKSARGKLPLAVIRVDLDQFKRINDSFGHEAGDTVIVRMAQLLKLAVDSRGEAGRTGADDFVVIVQDHDLEAAAALANRVKNAFSHIVWPFDPLGAGRTASFGITMFAPEDTCATVTARAEAMLYLAKHSGRNRVMYHETSEQAPVISGGSASART